MNRFSVRLILILASGVLAAATTHADDEAPRYLRIVEEPTRSISLEIATIDMLPGEDAAGPRIGLVGVAHLGSDAFYKAVADLLTSYDIVLFEAVQPVATGLVTDDDETARKQSRETMAFVAAAIEAYKQEHEQYPADLEELRVYVKDTAPIISNWLMRAMVDAWGQPLLYALSSDGSTYTLQSQGNGDVIVYEDQASTAAMDLHQDNLQQQLAEALGLEFQLHCLPYDAENWRPSDMTVAQLNEAFARHDVDFSVIGGTLAGTSFPAKLVGGLLKVVAVFDAMAQGAVSDMMKVMMIEMLGNESVLEMSMGQLGEGFAAVIIDERNQVVIDDLKALIQDEPHITSVAVLYGAAHLPDFVQRLEQQMGYVADETQWLSAISVDIQSSQMTPSQVRSMRQMVQRMLRQQMAR